MLAQSELLEGLQVTLGDLSGWENRSQDIFKLSGNCQCRVCQSFRCSSLPISTWHKADAVESVDDSFGHGVVLFSDP